jgi:hypothetical protein
MKHIKTFEQALNESENVATQKSAALDFVEDKGSATWKEIHTFLMNNKGFDPSDPANRGNMASYFSGGSSLLSYMVPPKSKTGRDAKSHGLLMIPTDKDPRYLEKSDGKYVVKIWDKKSKL